MRRWRCNLSDAICDVYEPLTLLRVIRSLLGGIGTGSSLDLVLASDLLSDEYRSGPHKALLFRRVHNVDRGELYDRSMTSGMHTIQNIFCAQCSTELGWTYVRAASAENQHKVGCFILVQPDIRAHHRGRAKGAAHSRPSDPSVPSVEAPSFVPASSASASHSILAYFTPRGSSHSSQSPSAGSSPAHSHELHGSSQHSRSSSSSMEEDEAQALAAAVEWAGGGSSSRVSASSARAVPSSAAALAASSRAPHASPLLRLRVLRAFLEDMAPESVEGAAASLQQQEEGGQGREGQPSVQGHASLRPRSLREFFSLRDASLI